MYQLRILDTATRELAALDRQVAIRIAGRIRWLADNIESIKPLPLTGAFSDLYKFRVGDYRVIYEILRAEQTLVVHAVGHRREIYRPAEPIIFPPRTPRSARTPPRRP